MDQSEADRDLSVKQRLALAAGSTIQGASGFAGDIEPLADALDVAGILQLLPHYCMFFCLGYISMFTFTMYVILSFLHEYIYAVNALLCIIFA